MKTYRWFSFVSICCYSDVTDVVLKNLRSPSTTDAIFQWNPCSQQ